MVPPRPAVGLGVAMTSMRGRLKPGPGPELPPAGLGVDSRGRRWAWLPVLLAGIALFAADQQAIMLTGNLNLVPSLLLFGTLLVPAPFVIWLDGRRPDYQLPISVLLMCGLLGGALGTVAASILESGSARRFGGTLPTLLIGLIEESAKLMVPIIVLVISRDRAIPADGLLVGVAVGAGFAVLETLGYGFVTLLATRGDLVATESLLLIRGVLSPAAHIAWTGLAAAALWHARARGWRPSAVAAAVGTFALVVVLHAIWDTYPDWPTFVLVGAASLALLIRQTHRDVPHTGQP
ncbi:MAG: protease PrsW [Pseudonocardiales bacterium]|nr:protease PrsW [Pseudonocardiales bacterium]